MTAGLKILTAGPAVTIQDHGRPGYAQYGLSKGGAMDDYALSEGEALLGNTRNCAAIEMAGYGGQFQVLQEPVWVALTGAPMQAMVDGTEIPWRSSQLLAPGQIIEIGSPILSDQQGVYGYLHVAGGFSLTPEIGAVGTHLRAGVGGLDGKVLSANTILPISFQDTTNLASTRLPVPDYLGQRTIRILWGAQSERFQPATRHRLLDETFCLSHRRDRMAMRLSLSDEQAPFEALLSGLSDPVQDGEIQMTGDGVPAILVREHQPTGGYPRIASVISADLDAVAQLPSNTPFAFQLVTLEQAIEALKIKRDAQQGLARQLQPVIRSPEQIDNLLDYNLIGGVISASTDSNI